MFKLRLGLAVALAGILAACSGVSQPTATSSSVSSGPASSSPPSSPITTTQPTKVVANVLGVSIVGVAKVGNYVSLKITAEEIDTCQTRDSVSIDVREAEKVVEVTVFNRDTRGPGLGCGGLITKYNIDSGFTPLAAGKYRITSGGKLLSEVDVID